jgi:hypothetical protein
MGSIAYNLTDASRDALIKRFPPLFSEVKCHHITVEFGVPDDKKLPSAPNTLRAIAYVSDDAGIECLVVKVDGTVARGDGGTFHLTLSRNADRQSVESNDIIKNCKWKRLGKAVPIDVVVAFNED